MEQVTASCAEWQAILEAMPALSHPSIRQEVQNGIKACLARHSCANPQTSVTLELDDAGSVAVHRARHLVSGEGNRTDDANSAIAEAETIVREHQQRR